MTMIVVEQSLLDEINELNADIDKVLGAAVTETQEESNTTMSTATDILKGNASTALKTSGANAINKKLVTVTTKALADRGVNMSFFETQIGKDILANGVPALLLLASLNPTIAGALPQGMASKLAKVAAAASQGAMNETADRLIQSVIPILSEVAEATESLVDDATPTKLHAQQG